MRVVFDTNVLISALIKPGGTSDLCLRMTREGAIQSLISHTMLDELRRTVRTLKFETERAGSFIRGIENHSQIIETRVALHVIKADPSDDRILECAVEGKADAIISGDCHLLVLKSFRNIPILTVREFVDIIHA